MPIMYLRQIFTISQCILFLVITDCSGQAIHRSSYDEFCNETIKCDKRAWLSCQSSKCGCMLDDMVYDQVKYKCLSKSGERCRFQISEVGGDKNMFALYENTECVSNANCDNGFTCTCQNGYFETIDGTCLAQKDIKFPCSTNTECKQDKFLTCVEGTCQCSTADDHIYAKVNETGSDREYCVGKAGKLLKKETQCITGTELKNGVCVCIPETEFYAGLNGLCYRKVGFMGSCARDEECLYEHQFLSCANGKCGCDHTKYVYQTFQKPGFVETEKEIYVYKHNQRRPDYNNPNAYYTLSRNIVYGTWVKDYDYNQAIIRSKYNDSIIETLNQCVGLANHPCNPESNCIVDSTCEPTNSEFGTCKCNSGFSPTSTSNCGTGHGRKCSANVTCSDIFRCTNGVCNCPQIMHQIYDSEELKCIGFVSSFCSIDSDCNRNSVCLMNPKTKVKQCACKQGHVENSLGTCDKAWGTACNYDTPNGTCDSVAGLECRNGICECPDTLSQFDSKIRKCLGLVGSRCSLLKQTDEVVGGIQDFSRVCVDGAECFQEHPKVAGQCLCSGYRVEVTNDMICSNVTESTENSVTVYGTTDQLIEFSTPYPEENKLVTNYRIFDWSEAMEDDSSQIEELDVIVD